MKRCFWLGLIIFILFASSCQSPDVFEPVINERVGQVYSQSNVIGESGTGDGQFIYPKGIIVENDFIYVLDHSNMRIVKFTLSGDFVKNIPLTMLKGIIYPFGMVVGSNGNIFALNLYTYRLYEYTKAGALVQDHGIIAPGTGKFATYYYLVGITADENGFLYVLNPGGKIDKFNLAGDHIKTFGGTGTGNGLFQNPISIKCGPDGLLYVLDYGRQDVQVLTPNGGFIRKFGDNTLFGVPTAMGVDKIGYVYVADSEKNKLFKLKPTGELVTQWKIPTSTTRIPFYYTDIAIDDMFNVYVTDVMLDVVHVFSGK
ncbi:MAG: hypothetical protein PHV06_03260 [bacterium]|nr:hypothetical protein [bacterium]